MSSRCVRGCGSRARRVAAALMGSAVASLGAAAVVMAEPAGEAAGSETALWEYAFGVAVLFALPLALLVCGLLAMRRVSRLLRVVGLALLIAGALAILRHVLRTGVAELMPEFAVPVLAAAAIVYPLAAVALVRASSGSDRRLSSAIAASRLLIVASVIQFFAHWMLTSGE